MADPDLHDEQEPDEEIEQDLDRQKSGCRRLTVKKLLGCKHGRPVETITFFDILQLNSFVSTVFSVFDFLI